MPKLSDVFPGIENIERDLPEGMAYVDNRPKSERAKSKHNNRKVKYDGFVFDSLKEACRWRELKHWQDKGVIKSLERQVRFPCHINTHVVFTYVADFRYKDIPTGKVVIEDSKGQRTPVYKLKIKVLKACYPDFEVLET